MNGNKRGFLIASWVVATTWSSVGLAEGFFSDLWEKTTIDTALRADFSARTTDLGNRYNQYNLPFQDVEVARQAYTPPALTGGLINWTTLPLVGFSDTVKRSDFVGKEKQEINYSNIRFTAGVNTKFTDYFQFIGQFRAIYGPDIYGGFDAKDVSDIQGGISSGEYYRGADTGSVDYFGAKDRNGKDLNPFEFSGKDYEVDFPTFIVDYKKSNYDIRFGNQQIAWGQAIFLQTFDVPTGLDFRRHLILDRAIEEFSDKRVPKLALRGTVQLTDTLLFDSFVSKFQPSVLPNPNTTYNVIPVSFYKPLDNYYENGYDKKLDYGFRLKDDYGQFGWSAFAVRRYNPLGVFRWARSGINKGLIGALGTIVETAYALKVPNCGAAYTPTLCRNYSNVAEALADSPLSVGPGGVYSGNEWFATAGSVRLDGQAALNTAIEEFPALQDIYASTTSTVEESINELNTFFMGAGGSLRGTVEREYKRENVFGIGGSYVTDSEIGALNEIILNLEVQYTPERYYTGTDLGASFDKSDEYIATLVAEKWTRWSPRFPAAYIVFEFQHRSDSDLVGLSLKGYSGNDGDSDPEIPDGISSANYLVFAGFQPSSNRKFVFEWAFLYDVKGGLLAQPAVQWNLGQGMIAEFFYNYTNGHLYGNPTDNVVRAIDADDEVSVRLTYQF